MIYISTRCPSCGYLLSNDFILAKQTLGPPTLNCPSCENEYSTGMKFWADMNIPGKLFYIVKALIIIQISVIFWGVVFSLIPAVLLNTFFKIDLMKTNVNYLLIYHGIIVAIVCFYLIKKIFYHVTLTKEKFDREGYKY